MKRWEIREVQLPGKVKLFVVVSPQSVIDGSDHHQGLVNALVCNSLRPVHQKKAYDVVLDQTDGLETATVVPCNFLYGLPRGMFGVVRGEVTPARREAITSTIAAVFRGR